MVTPVPPPPASSTNVVPRKLTPLERARIRAVSGCADETIRRYPHVGDVSRLRIERAAEALGIDLAPIRQQLAR